MSLAGPVSATEDPNFFAEWSTRRRRRIRISFTLLGSVLAHGLLALLVTSGKPEVAAPPSPEPAHEWLHGVAAGTKQLLAKHRLQQARRLLVTEARAARQQKALALGEAEGLVKTIFNAQSGALIGAHLIGAEATELIHGFLIAMNLETTEQELMETVFPHPTLSEAMLESVYDAFGRALHI